MYREPSWVARPKGEWALVEIKGGQEVSVHPLTKSCVTFGRAADQVDIALGHESCSRFHARIAFDCRGFLWLRDMGSTHGTSVNKKPIPDEARGKTESSSGDQKGSRGVLVYPGDLIQFGASTRLYCVEGPVEFQRETLQLRERLRKAQAKQDDSPAQNEVARLVNDQQDVSAENGCGTPEMPEKHRKQFEVLQTKRQKLHNLETERDRIVAKVTLTEGQAMQLERIQEKARILQNEIMEIESQLQLKEPGDPDMEPLKQVQQDYDDEDVDDRTTPNSRSQRRSREPETEDSLIIKWKTQQKRLVEQNKSMGNFRKRVATLEQGMENIPLDDSGDEFFLKNEIDLARDEYAKSEAEYALIQEEMKDIERLLRIVNDKLRYDRVTGYIGLCSPSKAIDALQNQRTTMLPPPRKPPVNKTEKLPTSHPKAVCPQRIRRRPDDGPVVETKRPRRTSSKNIPEGLQVGARNERLKAMKETQVDSWTAPQDQDGSGRTKLNAKFGGRY